VAMQLALKYFQTLFCSRVSWISDEPSYFMATSPAVVI